MVKVTKDQFFNAIGSLDVIYASTGYHLNGNFINSFDLRLRYGSTIGSTIGREYGIEDDYYLIERYVK